MHKTIIEPSKSPIKIPIKELFEYRELIGVLALRDFRVKYAQTFIGFLWAFINPLFSLLILHFVFGQVVKVDTGGTPHVIFTLAGLIGWNYFATLVSEAGHSIISAQDMIKKIYFPRLVIPVSKAITGLIDFFVVLICFFPIAALLPICAEQKYGFPAFFFDYGHCDGAYRGHLDFCPFHPVQGFSAHRPFPAAAGDVRHTHSLFRQFCT